MIVFQMVPREQMIALSNAGNEDGHKIVQDLLTAAKDREEALMAAEVRKKEPDPQKLLLAAVRIDLVKQILELPTVAKRELMREG